MEKLTLSNVCFKIDRANAKAMIEGFIGNSQKIHQCIYCMSKNTDFPKLITLNKTKDVTDRFPLSQIGLNMQSDNYSIPLQYIVQLVDKYYIKNDLNMWNEICTNNLFDIWLPQAPYKRYQVKTYAKNFYIALLRVYKINEKISNNDINWGDRYHSLKQSIEVTIEKPIVDDGVFNKTKVLLEDTLQKIKIL